MKRDAVVFIIPAYNEGAVIKEVINEVTARYPMVVCVDDGSSDATADYIGHTGAYLVQHPINLGQGAALQTGIEYARTLPGVEYFVTFDADGQHSLDDVDRMVNEIASSGVDIVLGSRFLGKVENITPLKKFILRLAVAFSNGTSGVKLTDTHNGLRVFNMKVASTLNITMPDFAHASEIIERISEMSYKYKEVPVTITYTEYSKSKGQSIINAINIGFDMLLNRMVNR